MAKKKYQNFEIMTMQPEPLIEELKREIEGNGSIKYIKELLHWGHFDVNTMWVDEDDVEWTFLMKASYLNKPKIVKVLLEDGADPNIQAADGSTALIEASNGGRSQVVEALLKHPSTDPNVQDEYGYTALIEASRFGRSQAAQALLSHPSTDPNIQRDDGDTALHWASSRGHSQVVQEILNHPKTDITITNKRGQIAWDQASKSIRNRFSKLNPQTSLLKEIKMLKSLLKKVKTKLPKGSKEIEQIENLLS